MYPAKNFFIVLKQVTVGNKYYYAWLAFLGLLMFIGAVSYGAQLQNGLIVTAMRDQVSWGFYISNFTFLVGLAAAAVLLVVPAYIYNFKPSSRSRRSSFLVNSLPSRQSPCASCLLSLIWAGLTGCGMSYPLSAR
jgi:hypothetical protein